MPHRPLPVKKLLHSGPVLKQLQQSLDLQQQLLSRVRSLLPAPLAPHCKAVIREQDHTAIFADSSVWASRIRYAIGGEVEKSLHKALATRRIRVRIHYDQVAPRTPTQQPLKLSDANSRLLNQLAEHMKDPLLSRSLRRLSRRRRM